MQLKVLPIQAVAVFTNAAWSYLLEHTWHSSSISCGVQRQRQIVVVVAVVVVVWCAILAVDVATESSLRVAVVENAVKLSSWLRLSILYCHNATNFAIY